MNLEGKFSNLRRNFKGTLAALSLSAFLCGCPSPLDTPSSETVKAAENVKILPDSVIEQIDSVEENSILLHYETSETDSLSPGDIIVCGVTGNTPEGLLRKVEGISFDKLQIYTSPAALEELADNYSVNINQQLDTSQLRSVSMRKEITPSRSANGFGFFYDIDNLVIYDADSTPNNGNEIKINGSFSVTPNLEFNLEVRNFKLQNLKFKTGLNENLELEATSPILLQNLSKEIDLMTYNFSPIIFAIPTVPPIPIVITPKIELGLEFDGSLSKISTSLEQDANLNFGVEYASGKWNPIIDFTKNFNFNQDEFSKDIKFKLSANARLSAALYGCLGAYAEATGYLQFGLFWNNPWKWKFIGGLSGAVGIEAKVLSFDIAKYENTLFDDSTVLFESAIDDPQNTKMMTIPSTASWNDAYIHKSTIPGYSPTYSSDGTSSKMETEIFSAGEESRSLMQFYIPLSSTSHIVLAKLDLYGDGITNFPSTNPIIRARRITNPWNESSVNWNSVSTGEEITSLGVGNQNWYEFDITSAVQKWVNYEWLNYGLEFYVTGDTSQAHFNTSESSSNTPKLIITYY